jgi:hypothetical protein
MQHAAPQRASKGGGDWLPAAPSPPARPLAPALSVPCTRLRKAAMRSTAGAGGGCGQAAAMRCSTASV